MNLECKRNKGEIVIQSGKWYLDQLSDEPNKWISTYKLDKYLLNTYGINREQYYRIICRNNINDIPKCGNPECNNLAVFWGLTKGYSVTCGKRECWSAIEYLRSCEMWNKRSPDRIKEIMTNMHKAAHDPKVQALAARNKFINAGDSNDLCEFYIASYDKYFKFGVSYNTEFRAYRMNYNNYKIILRASRIEVAELEYKIKLKLNKTDEWLLFNYQEIHKFIIAFNQYSSTTKGTIQGLEI